MCISPARRFTVPWSLHIRLGIEIMVCDGSHHFCAVRVVNDMYYVVFIVVAFDYCNMCCVDGLFHSNKCIPGLFGLDAIILLPFYCNAIIVLRFVLFYFLY